MMGKTTSRRPGAGPLPRVQKLAGPEQGAPRVQNEDLTLEVTLSTESPDRDGDRVATAGWEFENFLNNPVVLWAHDTTLPPVAKVVELYRQDGALKARLRFTPKEVNPFGYMTYQLYAQGFLNAVSVGFLPRRWQPRREEDLAADAVEGQPAGIHYLRQELLEVSCVPLPANPKALVTARRQGIDVDPLLRWTERALADAQPGLLSRPQLKVLAAGLSRQTGWSSLALLDARIKRLEAVVGALSGSQFPDSDLSGADVTDAGSRGSDLFGAPLTVPTQARAGVSDAERALAALIGQAVARRIGQLSGGDKGPATLT